MDKQDVSSSCLFVSEEKSDSLYPMYIGVSCAFFALKLLSGPAKEDEKWCELRDKMLQGSSQLLGLLIWRIQREGANVEKHELVQKLEAAEQEVEELKRRRHEDAKANEKVVGIFASQEQSWLIEGKKLRQQIGALLNQLRLCEKRKEQALSELHQRLKEMELLVQSKDKVLEEEEQKRKELEEKLKKAENLAEEFRETAKREAHEHSSELWKHKTAFIELVSNQRQLEAEMGRALKQVEAKKQELDLVLDQKEESVLLAQKLSVEMVKMHKDLEQKDKILSAMLRKSKLDTAEKQILVKEVKLSKVRRKQAELETEKWRAMSESRHDKHSLRTMFASQFKSKLDIPSGARGISYAGKTRSQPADDYDHPELSKDSDCGLPEGNEEIGTTTDIKRLEDWVHSEAEKYATVIEKRHCLELDAFAEQLRLKDEKLEAFRWRLLSTELELKRLQSHIEVINREMSQLKHDNMKLEAMIVEREEEITSLKEQFASETKSLSNQKTNVRTCSLLDPSSTSDAIWSEVKTVKRKPAEEPETKTVLMEMPQGKEAKKEKEASSPYDQSKNATLIVQSPEKEFDEVTEASKFPGEEETVSPVEVDTIERIMPIGSPSEALTKMTRMDLHALGVSYKIKRLKQQLLLFDRLIGKQESGEISENNDDGIKGFLQLMSLLNKQVSRYQSLQGKTDDLCKRMHENDLGTSCEGLGAETSKGDTKSLEHFLEETFQLQRYMVATGQKLMEIQSKIASTFIGIPQEFDSSSSFDINRFADTIRALFQEIQRGLEVRIARIIGDLEGTLACQGMKRFRR